MAQGIGIYQLPEADTLTGDESIPIDSGADTKRTTVTKIREGLQAEDGTLTALAGKATAADLLPYFTGAGAADTTTLTAFARSLLAGTSAAAMLTTLGALATNGDGSNVVVGGRTLAARAGDRITAKDLGAAGDGATNDRTALALAGSADLILPPGTYLVDSDLTISGPVRFAKGAKIKATGAVTITFAGGIHAPLAQIFDLSSGAKVEFSNGCQTVGHPEWWGAIRNDAASASLNTAAINACIVACSVTQLQAADYFHSATIDITTSHRSLVGHAGWFSAPSTATRLVCTSATATALRIDTLSAPSDPALYVRECKVRDLEVTRSAAPDGNPAGVYVGRALETTLERVTSAEHGSGFYFERAVVTKSYGCRAFRSVNGTNALYDRFYGYFLNGAVTNPSTYFFDCAAGVGGSPDLWDSIGLYLADGGNDTFSLRHEISGAFKTGIVLSGNYGGSVAAQQSRDIDIRIISPVVDSYSGVGIRITNLATGGAVTVTDAYCAPANPAATYGIQVDGSHGVLSLTDCQVIGHPAPGLIGIGIVNSSGVQSRCKLVDCDTPVLLVGASGNDMQDMINNPTHAPTYAHVWVQAAPASARNRLAPMIRGAAQSPRGVWLQGGSGGVSPHTNNEINVTGIDPAALTGGAAAKLYIAGAAVTATGAVAGNLVTGVMS